MSDKSKSLLESSSEFNVLRLREEFCDAVVQVEDVAFEIHKAILSKCSMYFT